MISLRAMNRHVLIANVLISLREMKFISRSEMSTLLSINMSCTARRDYLARRIFAGRFFQE